MVATTLQKLLRTFNPLRRESGTYLHLEASTPLSSKFPEAPPPDPRLTPILLAAQWITRDLYADAMPGIAADLLEAGYDTPSLRRLAGEILIVTRDDADQLVSKMFRELGHSYSFSETQAKLIVTRQIAREVIAGKRDAYAAASHIERVIWGREPATPDIEELFMISDEYHWDAGQQRYLPGFVTEQLEVFARLAVLPDEIGPPVPNE